MKKKLSVAAILSVASILVVGFVLNPFASATVPGNNTRASVSNSGSQSSKESVDGSISRDGRFVAFSNQQDNFVGTDCCNTIDVFVRNLSNNTTAIVSVSTLGAHSNASSYRPVISETGRYIVFRSDASNLVDGRTISATGQMYMRDTKTNTTTVLSEITAGTFANASITPLEVSSDGRFILFDSQATNLVSGLSSGFTNIFLLDRDTNTISWVNEPAAGSGFSGSSPYNASMSCDGAFIVLDGNASYYGLTPTSHLEVLLIDRRGGKKITNITAPANAAAVRPEISCNGNYIGFGSYANNLDPITAGMSVYYHAYMYDRINNQFKLLDQNSSGTLANADIMYATTDMLYLSLSDKGTAVFKSTATNLAGGASGSQLYFRNPSAGTTELLTRDSGGTQGNNSSEYPTISLDGRLAAYQSYASNLVSSDNNGLRDVFVSETGF